MSANEDLPEKGEARLLELIKEIYANWDAGLPPHVERMSVYVSAVAFIEAPLRKEIESKDATIRILVEMLTAKSSANSEPPTISDPVGDRRRAYDRSRKRTLPSDWPERRRAVFERDGFQCVYCGASECPLHCDHVIALSRGGSHELSNLVTACGPCNIRKNNRLQEEFLGGEG